MGKFNNKFDLDTLEKEFYNEMIDDYNKDGMQYKWTMKNGKEIKLIDMEDSHIKNCINMISNKESNCFRESWIFIFNDVLMKRRTMKINKIKLRIWE